MAFDANTHTQQDAPASREARNAAILEAQHAHTAIVIALLRLKDFAGVAVGSDDYAEIKRIEAELKKVRATWPLGLCGLRTDLQRNQDEAASKASSRILQRHYERGELSTVGD